MSPGYDDKEVPVKVYVDSADGSEIAAKLAGRFEVGGQQFRFTAIAFGRIGGHNASVTIAKTTLSKVARMGIDTEALQLAIQRKIIEGDVTLPEGIKPPPE
ncbi:MAG: hypothetical protein C4292_04010 [Nitrososphaera sp.]